MDSLDSAYNPATEIYLNHLVETTKKQVKVLVVGTGGTGLDPTNLPHSAEIINQRQAEKIECLVAQEGLIQKELSITNRKGISSDIMPAFNFSTSSGNTLRNIRRKNKISRLKRKRI